MASFTLIHNPRCSKSRNALKLLEERASGFEIIEYLDNPLSVSDIEKILKNGGYKAIDIVRTKEAKEEGLDPKSMSESELIKAIAKHPRILQRPIVIKDNKKALIAREEGWFEKF